MAQSGRAEATSYDIQHQAFRCSRCNSAQISTFPERRIQMSNRGMYVRRATTLAIALSCITLASIGGADSLLEKKKPSIADEELFFAPVPKAVCGPGDRPESALPGQG